MRALHLPGGALGDDVLALMEDGEGGIWVGTEDGLFDGNQKFISWLKEKGLQPTVIQTPGRHVWMVWRDNLAHFAPLLFQSK